uniref:Uncharacterized protein n=1 Tax=Clytia hemisphaerica TaxID=252671 RepID=A0A7M5WVF5_9CNID
PFGSIHPRAHVKADRLILGARATVYGEPDVNYRGPAIDRCLITRYQEQSVLRVDYKHLAGGIYLKSYNGFEILTTGSIAWIPTEIITVTEDKQSVLVTLPSPPDIKILGVRYAWAHHPCEYKSCAVYSVNNDLPSPQDICFIP